ncbi:winged helix-turn-helix transcriptional regulator [Bacillus sp. SIMBA_008]|uniref:winged helix-turn-helix transcriptional regulator n=1 Tax=Bacillus sp. SIMBA_008 TaxID=3085757 RepID=UPI0039798E47
MRRLEARALLVRTVFAEVPVRVEYSLTDLGVDAEKPLRALRGWVEANIERFPAID